MLAVSFSPACSLFGSLVEGDDVDGDAKDVACGEGFSAPAGLN